MKITLITLLTLIFSNIGAQSVHVTYNNKIALNIENFDNLNESTKQILKSWEKGELYSLLISEEKSIYGPVNKLQPVIKKSTTKDEFGNTLKKESIVNAYSEVIYKDLNSKQMISQVNFSGNTYLIEENTIDIKWEISKEKEQIGDFLCQKATAFINNDFVEAWFTTEIPIPNGPSVYSNLPGLIIQVKYGKRVITATKIAYDIKTNDIIPPRDGEKVSRENYIAIVTNFQNQKLGTTTTVNGNTTTTNTIRKN